MGACCTKEEAFDNFEISRQSIIKHLDNLDKEVSEFTQSQSSTKSFEDIKQNIGKVKEFQVICQQINDEINDLRDLYNSQVQRFEGVDLKYKSDQINDLKIKFNEIALKLKNKNDIDTSGRRSK
jgi:hypothetical protein